jgi:Na+/H+-dicarboxylate symporter/ABC-type amino acid transport substrate-binding protein
MEAVLRPPRLSLSAWILIGLGLGIFTGLFVGESATVLQPVADIYIRLMQMTVLPYLVLALIIGFGQLEAGQAKRLAARAGALLLATWALTFGVIVAMPATFPGTQSASFFSNALVEPRQPFSIPDLYFTANPFHSLANAVVPAVVLFSSMLGVALIGVEQRERLLGPLRVVNAAVVRITRFVIGLTPVGVFAIVAVTSGTVTPETLQRLEVYFVAFAAASLLLAFWILPLLVTAMTPFTYRDVMGVSKDALLTAFVASNAFIVLPILVERSKTLLEKRGLLNAESDSAAEILIPILFNFPNAGRLLTLLFVPFAAWLAGSPFSVGDFSTLLAVGIPSYFAKAQVALPFLLDVFKLPHDLFQLYIPTTIITGKFDSMVTAMNLLAFALLGAGAMGGFLELRRKRMIAGGLAMVAVTAVSVVGVRVALHASIDTTYKRDEALRTMTASRSLAPAIVHDVRPAQDAEPAAGGGVLERARARGTLRVGYDPANVPFSFFNRSRQLVGFDVELAHSLAESFGLKPEFVPVAWPELPAMLANGEIDVMPGMWVRPYWFQSVHMSTPYFTGTVGLVVRDERREEFAGVESLRGRRGLRVGVPLDARQLAVSLGRYFGDAPADVVEFESAGKFFEGRHPEIDAFLMPAEGAAAFTLLHPEFAVVVPQPDPVRLPYAFGLAPNAERMADAVNEWIVFAQSEGTIQRAYDYWVLGRGAEKKTPRWSILRNVLGWRPAEDRK